jgi:aminoglycoside phosphotransferase (APT) family kinase protein
MTVGMLSELVQGGMAAELSATPSGLPRVEHLRKVADALGHRAALEDDLGGRRAAMADSVRKVVAAEAEVGDGVAEPADPFAAVADLASALVRDASEGSRTASHTLRSLVPLLVATELPEVGEAAGVERNRLETEAMNSLGTEEAAMFGAEDVERYLSRAGVRRNQTGVTAVVRLSGGFSKHTTLVRFAGDTDAEDVVLRQAQPGRPAPGLAAEYEVLRFAWSHGIPVPEPLWIEPVDNELGPPFFACRRVHGENPGDVFGARPDVDPSVGHDLARIMAGLHTLDVSAVDSTPLAPMATDRDIRDRIAEQEALASTAAGDRSGIYGPLHALLFAWLRSHVPTDTVPALVHGDPGFHNILVRNGKVQALLDWERATIGDPALDLAYVRPQIEGIMPWESFLDSYTAAGGRARPPETLRFCTVWQDAWRAVGALKGRGRFVAKPVHVADAVTGFLHAPRFLLSAITTAFGGYR